MRNEKYIGENDEKLKRKENIKLKQQQKLDCLRIAQLLASEIEVIENIFVKRE